MRTSHLCHLEKRHADVTASIATAGEALEAARTSQKDTAAALRAAGQLERALQTQIDKERLARSDLEQRLAAAIGARDLLQASLDAHRSDRAEVGQQLSTQREAIGALTERIEKIIQIGTLNFVGFVAASMPGAACKVVA